MTNHYFLRGKLRAALFLILSDILVSPLYLNPDRPPVLFLTNFLTGLGVGLVGRPLFATNFLDTLFTVGFLGAALVVVFLVFLGGGPLGFCGLFFALR